jgi:hypothetical protein
MFVADQQPRTHYQHQSAQISDSPRVAATSREFETGILRNTEESV